MVAIIFCHISGKPHWVTVATFSFHVPAFFMISGALTRPGKFATWGKCVAHQARYILLPYFLLCYACIPFWYLNWKILEDSDTDFLTLFISPFVGNGQIMGTANGALWFLPTLFFAAILGWWILHFFGDRIECMLIVLIVCLSAAALIDRYVNIEVIWKPDTIPAALFYFLLGFVLMNPAKKLSSWISRQTNPAKVMLFVTGIVLVMLGYLEAEAAGDIIDLNYHELGQFPTSITASIVIICGYAIAVMALPKIPLLEWYGRVTMGTLAFHIPITRFLQNWDVTESFYQENPIWMGLIVTILTIPVNWVVYRWLPWLVGVRKPQRPAAALANSSS